MRVFRIHSRDIRIGKKYIKIRINLTKETVRSRLWYYAYYAENIIPLLKKYPTLRYTAKISYVLTESLSNIRPEYRKSFQVAGNVYYRYIIIVIAFC